MERRVLGRTGLEAGRIGMAASYGVPARAVERAFERGVPITCLDAPICDHPVEYIIVDLNNLTLANRADATATLNHLSRQYRLLKRAYGVELYIRRST